MYQFGSLEWGTQYMLILVSNGNLTGWQFIPKHHHRKHYSLDQLGVFGFKLTEIYMYLAKQINRLLPVHYYCTKYIHVYIHIRASHLFFADKKCLMDDAFREIWVFGHTTTKTAWNHFILNDLIWVFYSLWSKPNIHYGHVLVPHAMLIVWKKCFPILSAVLADEHMISFYQHS